MGVCWVKDYLSIHLLVPPSCSHSHWRHSHPQMAPTAGPSSSRPDCTPPCLVGLPPHPHCPCHLGGQCHLVGSCGDPLCGPPYLSPPAPSCAPYLCPGLPCACLCPCGCACGLCPFLCPCPYAPPCPHPLLLHAPPAPAQHLQGLHRPGRPPLHPAPCPSPCLSCGHGSCSFSYVLYSSPYSCCLLPLPPHAPSLAHDAD